MATLKINNTDVNCASYRFAKMEIDLDSGRNLNGVMERTVLAHHPRKLFIKFPPMNENAMYNLLILLDNSTLSVTAYNPFTKTTETMSMMHGDLDPEIYWDGVNPQNNTKEVLYKELSVELVEY